MVHLELAQWVSAGLALFSIVVVTLLFRAWHIYRRRMTFDEVRFLRCKITANVLLGVTQVYLLLTDTSPSFVLLKAGTFASILAGFLWLKTLRRYRRKP